MHRWPWPWAGPEGRSPASTSRHRLKAIFKTRAGRVTFVEADPRIEFREVAWVIDTAKGAGVDHIGLMAGRIETAKVVRNRQ